jgi:L-aminopeptidase/D-esterase-like protein
MYSSIIDVPGVKVGHYTDYEAATGCTVILCQDGAVAGVDVRGSAPGTRETDSLRPMNLIQQVHAILLSGGSAFGLDAAGGVMRYLEERGCGFDIRGLKVPIVPAAVLFDLFVGDAKLRPGIEEGYQACLAATEDEVAEGSVGAGTGATVGKILGIVQATKGGVGTASQTLASGIVIAALMVVNAFGDVVDPATGSILAGPRRPDNQGFLSTLKLLKANKLAGSEIPLNTTIGVVATNASLNKEQVNKLAQMSHDGLARAIQPCHTMVDGDTIFALSLGEGHETEVDLSQLGALASEVVSMAIVRAIAKAEGLAGIPAAKDIIGKK